MAKKQNKTKVKKTKVEVDRQVAPAINPGLVSIAMMPNDLATLTNLMTICAKTFEEQAIAAAAQNNEALYAVFSARQKLSTMFADRFVEFCNLGEPESRDMH